MNLSKQTQNITLCQEDLKGCRINTKFGFGEELCMQSNFIKSAQSVSSWSLCELREAKRLSEKISKVKKNLVVKYRFSKLMLLRVIFVRNSTEFPYWECAVTLH